MDTKKSQIAHKSKLSQNSQIDSLNEKLESQSQLILSKEE